jgi:chromosome segregation ATPase
MVVELLRYAARFGAAEYGVHPRTVERAIERHYTDHLRDELEEAKEQVERLLDQQDGMERQVVLLQAEAHTAQQGFMTAHEQAMDLQAQLEDLRDAVGVGREKPASGEVAELQERLAEAMVALAVPSEQLYAVQALTDLAAATRAVHDGAALADLQGQLVAVRRVRLYRDCGLVQATTVLAEGACVCTADGLALAGLPVPAGAK